MTRAEDIQEFYFGREAEGKIPKVHLEVNGGKVEVLDKLAISHGSTKKSHLIYPAKMTISFTTSKQFYLGDEVEVRLYHEGQKWDGLDYYSMPDAPKSNIFTAKITSRDYTPPTIKTGGFWNYKCEESFSEISQKISVSQGDTPSQLINQVSFLNQYEGENIKVASIKGEGEYPLDVVLSDLANYRSFQLRQENKNAFLEIKEKKAILQEVEEKVILTCDLDTVSNSIGYKETAKNLVQSAYWDRDEIEIQDKEDEGGVLPTGALSRGNGKMTVAEKAEWYEVMRNESYFNQSIGEIIKVFNIFVPKGEIGAYLQWILTKENKKESFSMATSFFSVPLGGLVRVATGYAGDNAFGYQAVITNKNITISFKQRLVMEFNVSVTKIGEWTPKRFDWGDNWDAGSTW